MLKGKTALVTGSTSGIGAGIAEALAAEGCNIVLNCMGDARQIATQRERLRCIFGIEAVYDDRGRSAGRWRLDGALEDAEAGRGGNLVVTIASVGRRLEGRRQVSDRFGAKLGSMRRRGCGFQNVS